MAISFMSRITVAPDVLVQELDGESVMLNLKTERYFGLDDVGTRIFTAVTNSSSIEQAYESLLGEFDVDRVVLRRDIDELLEKLLGNGLVEVG
ncbi:MAG TPA: PqqD family protein [Blastocatellia bacterium]|nr:PqqD family protein [Blastocatellia bacterium]